MGRHKQTFTLVFFNHGALDCETFDTFEALQTAARKLPEDAPAPLVFGARPIPYVLDREPRLVLRPSAPAAPAKPRKPRAKKEAPAIVTVHADGRIGNGNGTRVQQDFLENLDADEATNPLDSEG